LQTPIRKRSNINPNTSSFTSFFTTNNEQKRAFLDSI